jgi:hypothetical protein
VALSIQPREVMIAGDLVDYAVAAEQIGFAFERVRRAQASNACVLDNVRSVGPDCSVIRVYPIHVRLLQIPSATS